MYKNLNIKLLNTQAAIFKLVCVLLLSMPAFAAEQDNSESYVLFSIELGQGSKSTEASVSFTSAETNTVEKIYLGRTELNRYKLVRLDPGKYYISYISVFSAFSSSPVFQVEFKDQSVPITIYPQSINYIGAIRLDGDTDQRVRRPSFAANAETLREAASTNEDLFGSLDILIAMPDSEPIRLEKRMLGL